MILNLRRVAKDKKITLKKLQELSGVPMYVIHYYCNSNVSKVDLDSLKKLCEILECKASDILGF